MKAMFMTRLKTVVVMLWAMGMVAFGSALLARHTAAPDGQVGKQPAEGKQNGADIVQENAEQVTSKRLDKLTGAPTKNQLKDNDEAVAQEETPRKENKEQKNKADDPKANEAIVVNATELQKVFATNAALADERLKDKRIKVSGKMLRITRGQGPTVSYVLEMATETSPAATGYSYGLMQGMAPSSHPFAFRFSAQERAELAKLRQGQMVTIEGKCGDYTFDQTGRGPVIFTECKITKVE